jgi:LacI family transcriptional regulator
MNKPTTMKDIAEAVGVSVVTVSRTLAGKDGASAEIKEKILAKAKELGYCYASNKKNPQKSGGENIGVLVADRFFSDSAFYSKMYRAVVMQATAVGSTVLLEIVRAKEENLCILPNLIKSGKVDGIIFMGEMKHPYIRAVTASGLPYVFLDFYDDSWDSNSIVSDGMYGAYQLTEYLIATGHKSFAFVGSINATSSIMDRYLGFYKALLRHNYVDKELARIEDRDSEGHFIEFKLPQTLPDAFVCNCDQIAFRLIEQLKAKGYKIPEDVSVVGFDDFTYATMCTPQITTYRVNVNMMGQAAVSLILRKIRHKPSTKGRTLIGGEFVERASVKPR